MQVVVLLPQRLDILMQSSPAAVTWQHRHLRDNFLTVVMFWQFSEVKLSNLQAATSVHTYALKNTAVPCVNCDRPAFGPLCFSHPVRPAVLIQPINPESCKAWKALILDTCLLLARGDIFTLWPEEISTPLLFSHFSAHGSLWFSSNWSDIPHFPQETSAPQPLDCKRP